MTQSWANSTGARHRHLSSEGTAHRRRAARRARRRDAEVRLGPGCWPRRHHAGGRRCVVVRSRQLGGRCADCHLPCQRPGVCSQRRAAGRRRCDSAPHGHRVGANDLHAHRAADRLGLQGQERPGAGAARRHRPEGWYGGGPGEGAHGRGQPWPVAGAGQ